MSKKKNTGLPGAGDNVVNMPGALEQYAKLRDDLLIILSKADEDGLREAKQNIRGLALDASDRERMIKAAQKRHFELTGDRVTVGALRQEMAGPSRVTNTGGPARVPKWCLDWVWVINHNRFYSIKANNFASPQTFDMIHGCDVPEDRGRRIKATAFVAQHGFIPTVVKPVYMPTEKDKLIWVDGDYCINTFTYDSLPIMAEDYTDAGDEYIDMIEAHILMLCGNKADARILTQWLAHQVQHPGKKILWSPLIQSVEGIGKSFFSYLLRCGLGVRNVGVVGPAQLVSTFNGWATDVCVNILEELKIAGHNRYEALNAVKPLITDDFIQINTKGIAAYMTPNYVNYIAFTNAADALPLLSSDRRWWVVHCPLEHFTEVPDYENYFPKLFAGLQNHADEVCLWLMDYPITKSFMGIKQAPMTAAKASMVSTEEASFEGLAEVKSVIEEGGHLFDEQCLSSADVFIRVGIEYPDAFLKTNRRAHILKRLGYQSLGVRLKFDGKKKMFWTKKQMTPEEVRLYWEEKLAEKG